MTRNVRSLAAAALFACTAPLARADWSALNMPQGVTAISRQIYGLHMLVFWICVWIGVAVFSVMIYSIIKFRKSAGAIADRNFTHNTGIEIAWTIVPIAILIAIAIPSARVLLETEDTRSSELTIKVTGFQWRWQYDYLDAGVVFFSTLSRDSNTARELQSGIDPNTVPNYLLSVDHPLVVPVGIKVRLLVTGQDVIHSWWVPVFGVKKDAIPGLVNEAWFKVDADKPGLYRGQCAELCGRDHGFMPIVVDAKTKADYAVWLKAQQIEQKQAAAPATARNDAVRPAADAPPAKITRTAAAY
ncbi:MAG TPA: cytochrome c oxidase subunit II [Steroidobacteraceae bacterium]